MPRRKNVILIIWHDLGRHLSCYGAGSARSPCLDRMAADGVLFQNHFSVGSVCVPSRCGILTGKYPGRNELWRCSPSERALPALFRAAGYTTARFGFQEEQEFFPQDPNIRLDQFAQKVLGYGHVYGNGEKDAAWVADQVCRFLESHQNQPLFLCAEFSEAHGPYGGEVSAEELARTLPPPELPCFPNSPEALRVVAALEQKIFAADRETGRILRQVESSGLRDDTLVLFTTDHGVDLPRAKMTLYDPGIQAALILWGGCARGWRDAGLHSHVDLMPTLLEYAGLPVPEDIQGLSFLDAAYGRRSPGRAYVAAQKAWEAKEKSDAVRTSRYKYIRHARQGQSLSLPPAFLQAVGGSIAERRYPLRLPQTELYDLYQDPQELENLAPRPEYRAVLSQMEEIRKKELATEEVSL